MNPFSSHENATKGVFQRRVRRSKLERMRRGGGTTKAVDLRAPRFGALRFG